MQSQVIIAVPQTNPVSYTYKVKIINPVKKSGVLIREIHNFCTKFESVPDMREKLSTEFKDQVPSGNDFNVGYYDGPHHSKVILMSNEDLNNLYTKHRKGGEIILWCDGKGENKRKRNESTRQEREDDAEAVFLDLKAKHGDKFDNPKLRLWSKMIASNLHDNYDTPPDIPAFSGCIPKKAKKDSTISEALTNAAVAFANVCSGHKDVSQGQHSNASSLSNAVSPSKSVELRMKNFEQLRYLQHLYDDGILNLSEYSEQKESILTSLRKLT